MELEPDLRDAEMIENIKQELILACSTEASNVELPLLSSDTLQDLLVGCSADLTDFRGLCGDSPLKLVVDPRIVPEPQFNSTLGEPHVCRSDQYDIANEQVNGAVDKPQLCKSDSYCVPEEPKNDSAETSQLSESDPYNVSEERLNSSLDTSHIHESDPCNIPEGEIKGSIDAFNKEDGEVSSEEDSTNSSPEPESCHEPLNELPPLRSDAAFFHHRQRHPSIDSQSSTHSAKSITSRCTSVMTESNMGDSFRSRRFGRNEIISHLDLPPVEYLSISLTGDLPIRPLGKVAHFMENLAVIEGYQTSTVLDEGSVLFDEKRKSIGRVFETFGAVSQPCYTIRFNCMEDIETMGLVPGQEVFCVDDRSSEYNHVVDVEMLKRLKGTDAPEPLFRQVAQHADSQDEFHSNDDSDPEMSKTAEKRTRTQRKGPPSKPRTPHFGGPPRFSRPSPSNRPVHPGSVPFRAAAQAHLATIQGGPPPPMAFTMPPPGFNPQVPPPNGSPITFGLPPPPVPFPYAGGPCPPYPGPWPMAAYPPPRYPAFGAAPSFTPIPYSHNPYITPNLLSPPPNYFPRNSSFQSQ